MNTTTENVNLELEAYLCREMPEGTIIGDPKWWAPKIAMVICKAMAEQPQQEPGIEELEQENRLLRARNERLEAEQAAQQVPKQEPSNRNEIIRALTNCPHAINEFSVTLNQHQKQGPGSAFSQVVDRLVAIFAPPQRKPLQDEANAVIDAARAAMNGSVEANDSEDSLKLSSHLAASLSLCLDEYDRAIEAAHGIKTPQ